MPRSLAKTLRILFAPAAGPGVGGGHVMRCLTLAEALVDRGCACAFSVNAEGAALIARFGSGDFEVRPVDAPPDADVLVIDDYAAPLQREDAALARGQTLVVLDDLADRPHQADLLIDSGYGRRASDYDGLLPDQSVRLIGPDYAPVRRAFAVRRPVVLARPVAPAPRRLFLSFGLSDVGGVAARAVATIRARYAKVEIDLAIASGAESLPDLSARAKRDNALHLHLDAQNVPELMAAADLAVGAGGASTWERCCLGLPSLVVIVAENQRPTIERLAADGVVMAVDVTSDRFEAAFTDALARLWERDTRARLRERSAALCDGLGAERIADAILKL